MWIDDQVLKQFDKDLHAEIFVPRDPAVVLGSGNDQDLEVNVDACHGADIPVLRRYGGGGTVVLYSGCVVVSLGCWVKEAFQNSLYFDLINKSVIEALTDSWPDLPELTQAGISDIISAGRKVAGTSLFRSRNYLLYQASILVDLDRDLVSGLLRHPTKEPDYRKGRSHKDFLTSLNEIAVTQRPVESVATALSECFERAVRHILGEQLIQPIDGQKSALTARLERSLSGR
jgi:lipoate-protein ligase A